METIIFNFSYETNPQTLLNIGTACVVSDTCGSSEYLQEMVWYLTHQDQCIMQLLRTCLHSVIVWTYFPRIHSKTNFAMKYST